MLYSMESYLQIKSLFPHNLLVITMRALFAPCFPKQQTPRQIEVKSILYRALVAFFSGLWISFLPMYFAVLYMAERKFFSYEFLSEDAFGMKTMVISGVVLLFFLSMYMFGFLVLFKMAVAEGRKTGNYGSYRWLTWLLLFVAIFMHSYFFYRALLAGKPNLYIGPSAFAFIVCFYLSSFVGGALRERLSNWLPTVIFIGFTAFLPFVGRDVTADLVEISLRQFRVGGGIPVKITKLESQNPIIEGSLLLRTPKYLYIIVLKEGKSTLAIVRNGDDVRVDVENG
jgi:hypothetical protein